MLPGDKIEPSKSDDPSLVMTLGEQYITTLNTHEADVVCLARLSAIANRSPAAKRSLDVHRTGYY